MTHQAKGYQTITPDHIKPGMTVRVYQKLRDLTVKGEERERVQVFEGIVIRCRGRHGSDGSYTVRKISDGMGVEKIFPYRATSVEKVEFVKQAHVRRANLGYLRAYGKRLKETTKLEA